MSSDFNKDALLRSAKRINVSYFKEQQEDAINAIWQWWQSQSISFTLSGYAGTGKALLDDTKVLTINGWHSIGDIKVGDKVAVPTGGFYPVSAVYHHSDRPLYKLLLKMVDLLFVMRITYGKFVVKDLFKSIMSLMEIILDIVILKQLKNFMMN